MTGVAGRAPGAITHGSPAHQGRGQARAGPLLSAPFMAQQSWKRSSCWLCFAAFFCVFLFLF